MTEQTNIVVEDDNASTPGDTIVPLEKPKETPAATDPPATEEPKTEETNEEDKPTTETPALDYNTYENEPALKYATSILKEANLPVAEANAIFAKAVEASDITLIDRAALVAKLGEDKAGVVLTLVENYYAKTTAEFAEHKKNLTAITGGEENFEAMRTWARTKEAADPAFAKEMTEIRAMLETGKPRQMKAAITDLYGMYKADPKTSVPAATVEGTTVPNNGSVEPMSRKDYIAALQRAQANGTYNKERAGLWARRQAGMKQNI